MHHVTIAERPALEDRELNTLFAAAWPTHTPRAFGPVLERSLSYLGAFVDGELIGFVNVVWDGGSHAFLLDPTVHPDHQRQGLGRELVTRAAAIARASGAEWLHVDYELQLRPFYAAIGFYPAEAGLMRLHDQRVDYLRDSAA